VEEEPGTEKGKLFPENKKIKQELFYKTGSKKEIIFTENFL
jgi:hypothetical protein